MDESAAEHPAKLDALIAVLEDARSLGLLGPGPTERQYRHAADLARAIAPFDGSFLDLGSGAGLPGLVLARAFPASTGVFLDSQQRRCEFLRGAVERLAIDDRFDVVCGRAEVLARTEELRGRFDLVVARAFGPPAVTAECSVGFLHVGGSLVVTEPPDATKSAERWPRSGMAELGFGEVQQLRRGETGAMRAALVRVPAERWPRREGVPAKRPLW
jgi:16S rRNA (guanine527-N7)-methyltransferase